MLGFSLRDAVDKVAVKCFKTAFGRMLGTTTYQKERSVFKAVSWSTAQVAETALVDSRGNGSIEITDLVITTDKVNLGTVVLHWDDGTNEETVITTSLSDLPIRLNMHFAGKVQGWQGASLYYTVAGANSTGAITVVYIRHNKANSLPYAEWNARR